MMETINLIFCERIPMLNKRVRNLLAVSGIMVMTGSALAAAPAIHDAGKKDKVYEKVNGDVSSNLRGEEERVVEKKKTA